MFRQDVQEETAIAVGLVLPPSHTPAARRCCFEILFASSKRVLYHQAVNAAQIEGGFAPVLTGLAPAADLALTPFQFPGEFP